MSVRNENKNTNKTYFGDFFPKEPFLRSTVKKERRKIVKINETVSCMDAWPVNSINNKTMVTMTISGMVIYSGLKRSDFCMVFLLHLHTLSFFFHI
jgi:hypothetical protein